MQALIDTQADPVVVSYGGGVNSLGMLIGMVERGERPDAIVFADTRGEKPETYQFLDEVLCAWLRSKGLPSLTKICRADFPNSRTGDRSLEDECLRLGALPSRAYGYGTCADKWKIDPFKWWTKTWAQEVWARDGTVVRCIGFDAGEQRRVSALSDRGFTKRYPLLEWGWDREACIAAIQREGLPVPPKSACFFCPASTKTEILYLRRGHPGLVERAVAMESAALATGRYSIAGLGRRFAWKALIDAVDRERFAEAPVEACTLCADGDE